MTDINDLDFDAVWDYDHPDQTEVKFLEVLPYLSEGSAKRLELMTQIARAQGLQGKFDQAHRTLDGVESLLAKKDSRAGVRYLLERGRVLNSSGHPDEAGPFFKQALEASERLEEDGLAVDSVHMLAIVATPEEGLRLNLRGIELAEKSTQVAAKKWLGSLYNNTGWSYHDLGRFETALTIFRKGEDWQRSMRREPERRIATWCVGRTLRSLGRLEQALALQLSLQKEIESSGSEEDGFVSEEVAEGLQALGRNDEARPHFANAYRLLSRDKHLVKHEGERLGRLKQLGS